MRSSFITTRLRGNFSSARTGHRSKADVEKEEWMLFNSIMATVADCFNATEALLFSPRDDKGGEYNWAD